MVAAIIEVEILGENNDMCRKFTITLMCILLGKVRPLHESHSVLCTGELMCAQCVCLPLHTTGLVPCLFL